MKVPMSWLKDFVDITSPIEDLAERLTLAGLEVASIEQIGLEGADLVWDREKMVLGHILRVEQHPNADRLVLATVDIGTTEPEIVVTGAPNLFEFVGKGDISNLDLKSPFVMEGATVYDGHAKEPGKKMKLKGREIRGIMNRHMLCSEKEIGLSDDHEGIILAHDDASPGTPLVDLWGDIVLDLDLTPNLSRCLSIMGVAREVAALTGQKMRYPDTTFDAKGSLLENRLVIETTEPELNPRFIAILIEGITLRPSPYWMQRRLRLAGMRPINNIVDVSNYVMLEVGQPNHAFDWDILRQRADEYAGPTAPVKILTRLAEPGETVLTLDGKTHELPEFSILVTDPKGNLSIGGVMGGAESEVNEASKNILLEAAAWNFINIRRTSQALTIYSEAGDRFSRGVHPSQAMLGALRGAKLMAELAGGTISGDIVDYYPNPPETITIDLHQSEVTRLLGIELSLTEIKKILRALEFQVEETGPASQSSGQRSRTHDSHILRVVVPDYRLDIFSEPTTGRADLVEEIARIYGYDRLPVSEMADEMPSQRNNLMFDREESIRDLMVEVGMQEIITYRLTSPGAEARILGKDHAETTPYVTLANPTTPERTVMRHSLLNSVLEVVAENTKHQDRVQMFEVGHIYLPNEDGSGQEAILPIEQLRLAVVMTGPREKTGWLRKDTTLLDFYDLKGVVESLLTGLHLSEVSFEPTQHPSYHPGRVAELKVNNKSLGIFGQLHPQVVEVYDFKTEGDWPVVAADFDLGLLLDQVPESHTVRSVPRFPSVQQDIAIVIDEHTPVDQVQSLIAQSGQPLLTKARLFDVYRGDQIGPGKKSLAFNLTFQSESRTLTDKMVAKQQQNILKRLERDLGATLRS
jgi:phenylalanyl-tRNA synthetase beta chain